MQYIFVIFTLSIFFGNILMENDCFKKRKKMEKLMEKQRQAEEKFSDEEFMPENK